MHKTKYLPYALLLLSAGAAQAEYQEAAGATHQVVMEAENFHANTAAGSHTWNALCGAAIPAGALGDGAVQALPADATNFKTPPYTTNNPRLDYDVNFVGGDYYIWVLGSAPASNQDSVHIGLNGSVIVDGGGLSSGIGGLPIGSYGWRELAPFNTPVTIAAGAGVVNLFIRESGVIIDKIVFTTDAGFDGSVVPADTTNTGSTFIVTPPVLDPDVSADPNNAHIATSDNINMSTCTSGATIHYTTNGVDPTTGDATFGAPFTLAVDTTVKAFAVNAGYTDSAITAANYIINSVPVITSTGTTTATEDSAYTYDAGGITVTDGDGDTTVITNPVAPGFLTFVDNGNNTATLTGTPSDSAVGNRTVTIVATDPDGATATETYTLTTTNIPDNPTVVSPIGAQSATQGTPFALGDISGNFNDDDPVSVDTRTFTQSGLPVGTGLALSTAGVFSGTPNQADVDASPISITVTLTDNQPVAVGDTFALTVANINDAPTISGTPGTTVAQDAAYSFTPTSGDVDSGDVLAFSIVNKPSWASFSTTTGALTGTPTNADVGTTTGIVITVDDQQSQPNSTASLPAFNLAVTNVNDPPTISGTPGTTVAQDVAYSFTPTAGDIDAGTVLLFSIVNKPSWASFSTTTGALTGTPTNADVGTTTGIVITANDQQSQPNSAVSLPAFNLAVTNVNDAPVISGTPATSVESGSAYSFTPTASDIDSGDVLSFSITNMPGWASFSTTTGALTGTPASSDIGTTTGIVISVDDQQSQSNSAASLAPFNLTVTGVDSNSDGITDAEAIALGLDPNSLDSDGDGNLDAAEVGDVNNPTDTDGDGIIDALEVGTQANDAMIADNVSLDGGASVVIDVSAATQTLTNVSTAAATGGPAGVTFPFGTISYTTTSAVGGSVTVRMTFSSNLPTNMDLYKVDGGGTYTLMDTAVWTRVSDTVLEVTLTDGDAATDLDGLANGSIDDPIAPATVAASGGGGGGGCAINTSAQRDPTLPMLMLLSAGYLLRRRSSK